MGSDYFLQASASADGLDTLPEQLIELALQAGADAAEVFQSQSFSCPVSFEANRLKQLETSQVEGNALRLWRNGRPGLAVAYGDVPPQSLVAKALALSDLNDPEPIELTPGQAVAYPDLGTAVSVQQLVDWGEAAIDQVRQAYPEVLCEAELACDRETTRILNSQGLDYRYSDTTLSAYLSAEWVRGDDFLAVGDGQTRREPLDPGLLAQQILQRLAWADPNVTAPQGRLPVLFSAKAALSGKRVREKSSPWSDRLGDAVTAAAITLSQVPTVGPFSCPFDDEGTPTRPLTFIEAGVLKLFYTDRTVGRDLGGGSTGNGFRPGLGSYPTPGLFNTLLEPGAQSLTDLVAQIDDGILVDQVLGSDAGISGDFSVNLDLGYRIQQGQIVGRVKDTMMAGNVYTALKNLVALGNDIDWNGSCHTPSVLVEGLSINSRH
jgi:PmbA protein